MAEKEKSSVNVNTFGGWVPLLLVLVCIATCDDCAGCRKNAIEFKEELYPTVRAAEGPREVDEVTKPAPEVPKPITVPEPVEYPTEAQ
jgi:hypothetical protein